MSHPNRCPRCGANIDSTQACAACLLGIAMAPSDAPDLAGEQLGPYAITRMLGRGGIGVVYEAVDTRPMSCRFGRVVALKILAADVEAPELKRTVALKIRPSDHTTPDQLVREGQLAAALEHEHLVPVYEVGEHEGIAYLAMKRIDGGPLKTPAPHEKRAAEIALSIAKAVDYAHRHGILHRDLKPANVLVDGEGRVFVTDFGLAARDGLAAAPGGTPAYMAPEVWRGALGAASTAADIWGAGVILYELLAGRPPFDASSSDALMRQVIEEPPPALAGVHPDLAAVCLRCLEKDPARRYATAGELAADLKRFLDPEARRRLLDALLAAESAAHRVADLASEQFERYKAVVEAAGRDPRVARALADTASSRASEVCAMMHTELLDPPFAPFTTWSLLDADGRLIGRVPAGIHPTVGLSFAFRAYFRGVAELERQGCRAAYVSRAHLSEGDGDHRIAISFAVHDDADRWVGLLMASLPIGFVLGSISLDDAGSQGLTAALLAPRDLERNAGELDPEPIFILHSAPGRGEALPARADDVLGTDPGAGAFMRLVPVRGTPFSVLVRVALDGS